MMQLLQRIGHGSERESRRSGDKGANLVEYVLLLMFILMVAIVAVQLFGTKLSSQFSSATDSMFGS